MNDKVVLVLSIILLAICGYALITLFGGAIVAAIF